MNWESRVLAREGQEPQGLDPGGEFFLTPHSPALQGIKLFHLGQQGRPSEISSQSSNPW